MPFSPSLPQAARSAHGTFRKVLLALCAVLLAMQLMGTAFHDHDAGELLPDCVSCQIAGQPLADLPPMSAVLMAVLLVVAYRLTLRPNLPAVVVQRYLIPSRQAPPR